MACWEPPPRTGRSHGRAVDKTFFFTARGLRCAAQLYHVGFARRADQRETASQARVADLS
jgi:hypothetical protein